MPEALEDGLPQPARRYAITATAIGTLIAALDVTIANIALPTISHDLGVSAGASIWIVNAYQFAMLMLIIPLASLGDMVGYARVYRVGLLVFTVASLACACSRTLLILALARIFQGAGAAAMTSTIGSLNRHAYPRSMLGRAAGQGAMMVALGAAAGPVVGGMILGFAAWPWLFAVNVPVGVVALILSARFLPSTRGSTGRFDWMSATLSACTFGLLVLSVEMLGHQGATALAAALLFGAITLGVIFIRAQRRQTIPMFAVDLFAKPVFSLSIVASVTSFIAQTIAYVALPFAFELLLGRTPFESGLLMAPWLLATAALAPLAGRLSDRYDAGVMGGAGMALLAGGLIALNVLPAHANSSDIIWRMALCGAGYGLFQSPNNRTILSGASRERTGAAQGILATARLIGQSTGAALVALVFDTAIIGASSLGPSANRITIALSIATLFALVAGIASVLRFRAPRVRTICAP